MHKVAVDLLERGESLKEVIDKIAWLTLEIEKEEEKIDHYLKYVDRKYAA